MNIFRTSLVIGAAFAAFTNMNAQEPAGDVIELSPFRVFGRDGSMDRIEDTSVFTTGAIDLYQMDELQETTGLVPNFQMTSSDTRGFGDVITMRGMGNSLFFSPAGVAMYVDDVPAGDAFSYSTRFNPGSSLSIHRGGRGSYFGRNGPAGVIEIQSRRPSEYTATNISAEVGSNGYRATSVSTSGALGESNFAHSLNLYYSERDGFVNNVTSGKKTDGREAIGGDWSLYWKVDDTWDVRFKASLDTYDDGSSRLSSLFSPDMFTVSSDLEGETSIDKNQYSVLVSNQFDWGTFKSITAVQSWDLGPSTVDLDLSATPISTSSIFQDQTMYSQEFRFESPVGDGPMSWRAGLFFMDKQTRGDATRTFPVPPYFPVFTENTVFDIDEETLSAFAHVNYKTSETLTFNAGVRIQNTKTSISRVKVSTIGVAPISGSVDDTYASPDAGFEYKLSDDLALVGRSSLSFKPKGFTAFTDNAALAEFKDESAWSNEIGLVYRSEDSPFDVRLTAYSMDIDDYQLEQSVPNSTDFVVINADEVSSWGLESEVVWRASDNLLFEASVGYSSVDFDSHTDPFTNVSYNGMNVPFVSEYTTRGSVLYNFDNGFFIQSSVRGVGDTYYNEANSAMFSQGSYSIWDAQVGYRKDGLSVVVYGKNLGDEEYYTFINPQIFAGAPGDPQTFGTRVSYSF